MRMQKMNNYIIVTIAILATIGAKAQQSVDSLQQRSTKSIKEKFASTRLFNFEYGQSLSRDFDSEIFGEDFQEGELKTQRNFKASMNLPIYKTKRYGLTGSFNYQFNELEFDDLETTDITVFEQNGIVNFHNFSAAVSSTYFSTLFKIPVIYNASIIVDGNDKGLERIKGLVGFSLILKRTARTTMTLGAIAFVDPTSQLPFFPTFSYNHKFKNSKWEMDFILPQRLLFRRFVGENGRFSVGSSFGSTGFYVNVDNPNFASVFEYSQLEVKSGIIYEHRLNDYVVGTFQGGLQNFISNRLTEKGEPTKDFIYQNNQDATGYFQVGISIDPFAKK